MKSTHKVERFDYSKYESNPSWDSDSLKEYEFWGYIQKLEEYILILKDMQRLVK